MTLDRRDFLAGASTMLVTAPLLPACADDGSDSASPATGSTSGFQPNQAWEDQADTLEAEGVFTTAAPGVWAGKEGSHAPEAMVSGLAVTISTTHGMEADHWIDVIYARDQDGVVVALLELAGTDAAAEASFMVPEGTTSVTPYAHCNQHGLWMGDLVAVD